MTVHANGDAYLPFSWRCSSGGAEDSKLLDATQALMFSLASRDTKSLSDCKWDCPFQRFVAIRAIEWRAQRFMEARDVVPILSHLKFILRVAVFVQTEMHVLAKGISFDE